MSNFFETPVLVLRSSYKIMPVFDIAEGHMKRMIFFCSFVTALTSLLVKTPDLRLAFAGLLAHPLVLQPGSVQRIEFGAELHPVFDHDDETWRAG